MKRLSSAAIRWAFRQPRTWIPLVVLLGVLVLLAAVAVHIDSIGAIRGGIVGLVVVAVYIPATTLRKSRKQFALIAFPGARWAIGYGPSSLVIYQPTASAVIDYSLFKSAARGSGNTIILQHRSRLFTVLPGELCPPAALPVLADAIERSRPR